MQPPVLLAINLAVPVVLLSTFLAVVLIRRRNAAARGPAVTQADGSTELPVVGIYTRSGFLGGSAHNSMNPHFAIGPDGIDLRILRRRHLAFAEIESADARKTLTGMALILRATGSRIFAIRFAGAEPVRQALALLPPGLPVTEAAATVRDGSPARATPGLRSYTGRLQ